MQTFNKTIKLRFAHCDPAGIIFYPRYFELLNSVTEDWFEESLKCSFNKLHLERGLSVPLIDVKTNFIAPCRLGDRLEFRMSATRIGKSSCSLSVSTYLRAEKHISSEMVIVCTDLDAGKSSEWPEDIKLNMMPYLKTT